MFQSIQAIAMKRLFRKTFSLLLLLAFQCHAIDNPDVPDYTAEFEARARPFKEAFANQTGSLEIIREGERFSDFLDQEMKKAIDSLNHHLKSDAWQKLQTSQAAWQKYYQTESAFIIENWTKDQFGTSYVLPRSDYLNTLKETRIKILLSYLKNYASNINKSQKDH